MTQALFMGLFFPRQPGFGAGEFGSAHRGEGEYCPAVLDLLTTLFCAVLFLLVGKPWILWVGR